jgi:hypothetical protein
MSGLTGKFSEAEQSIESSGSNLAATGQQLEDIGEKANKALEIFGQLTEEIRGPMVDAMKAGFGEQASGEVDTMIGNVQDAIGVMGTVANAVAQVGTVMQGVGVATEAVGAAMALLEVNPVILGITAAAVGIVAVIKLINNARDSAKKTQEQMAKDTKEAQEKEQGRQVAEQKQLEKENKPEFIKEQIETISNQIKDFNSNGPKLEWCSFDGKKYLSPDLNELKAQLKPWVDKRNQILKESESNPEDYAKNFDVFFGKGALEKQQHQNEERAAAAKEAARQVREAQKELTEAQRELTEAQAKEQDGVPTDEAHERYNKDLAELRAWHDEKLEEYKGNAAATALIILAGNAKLLALQKQLDQDMAKEVTEAHKRMGEQIQRDFEEYTRKWNENAQKQAKSEQEYIEKGDAAAAAAGGTKFQKEWAAKEGAIKKEHDRQIAEAQAVAADTTAIDASYEKQRIALAKEEAEAKKEYAMGAVETSLKAMESLAQANHASAGVQRAISMAMIAVNTAQAATKALASGPPPWNFVEMAAVIAAGVAQEEKAASAKFALGTGFAPGGMAMVGEQGPELVNLPRGAQVYNHTQTQNMTSNSGHTFTIHVHDAQGNVLESATAAIRGGAADRFVSTLNDRLQGLN